jgi:hypothetical protein
MDFRSVLTIAKPNVTESVNNFVVEWAVAQPRIKIWAKWVCLEGVHPLSTPISPSNSIKVE